MVLKINHKIFLMMAAFFLVPVSMFVATLYIVNQQRNDGLMINLAGRQRMLSQKMSKECLTYLHLAVKNPEGAGKTLKTLQNTISVFDITLRALIESGEAPLSLNLKGDQGRIPAAQGEAAVQLKRVNDLWYPFRQAIQKVIDSETETDIGAVLTKNLPLLREMDKAVQIMQKQAEAKVNRLFYTQLFCLFFGILVVIVILVWSSRAIIKPIRAGADLAKKMADGDLSREIESQQNDEIGDLTRALNHTIKTLSRMIGDINQDVITLNTSSREMNEISEQMASVSNSTVEKALTVSAAAEETDASMNSVAAAMEQASSNMDSVASATEEMSSNVNEIADQLNNANQETNNAVERSMRASEQVSRLGSAAEEISVVSETITDITDKTELLALNATIEAARAGEAGKGFAVVAGEIKELAQQTAAATGDISEKLKRIQLVTEETIQIIGEISNATGKSKQSVEHITTALEHQRLAVQEIATNVNQASLGLKEISQNVSQTNQATSQVAHEINEVNEYTGQLNKSSTRINQTAAGLNQLSEHLKNLVEKFKIA